jgi:hypothetical protein
MSARKRPAARVAVPDDGVAVHLGNLNKKTDDKKLKSLKETRTFLFHRVKHARWKT